MTYEQYQEHYERTAKAESKRLDAMSVAAIVSDIEAGRFGETYQIWHSLGKRAGPAEANELLLSFLASNADYLHRYHCAAALIQINRLTGWEPDQLSAESTQPVAKNLEKVRAQLVGETSAARR